MIEDEIAEARHKLQELEAEKALLDAGYKKFYEDGERGHRVYPSWHSPDFQIKFKDTPTAKAFLDICADYKKLHKAALALVEDLPADYNDNMDMMNMNVSINKLAALHHAVGGRRNG